jgi:hypothetical protein
MHGKVDLPNTTTFVKMNSSVLKSEFMERESMEKITCANVLEIYLSFILSFEIMTAQEYIAKAKCASTLS